ncbi:MAG: AAA family ATPase [Caldilineaceae bacterium]
MDIATLAQRVQENVAQVIIGKQSQVELMLVALLADGHVLLEDVPGIGKTTLAKALARSIDCTFARIQFTPDLLPSDVTGINFFNQKRQEFEFRPGPAFSQILLADEINRATPRTQSSLLEAMQEQQITVDGMTMALPAPSWSSPPRIRWNWRARSPCPRRSWTAFCSRFNWAIPRWRKRRKSCCATSRAIRWSAWSRWPTPMTSWRCVTVSSKCM